MVHEHTTTSPHWKLLPEDINEAEFFNQMGIGMLDSEESLSGDGPDSKQMFVQDNLSEYKDIASDYEGDQNYNSHVENVIKRDMLDTSRINATNIEVYSDPVSSTSTGRAIRGQAISKIVGAANAKKRSPLATVVNNNNIMRSESSLASKKYIDLIADEKFFEFKKEQAESRNQPSMYLIFLIIHYLYCEVEFINTKVTNFCK